MSGVCKPIEIHPVSPQVPLLRWNWGLLHIWNSTKLIKYLMGAIGHTEIQQPGNYHHGGVIYLVSDPLG